VSDEKRHDARTKPMVPADARITLVVAGQEIAIRSVDDVSPFGLGVHVDDSFPSQTPVDIHIVTDASELQLSGTIVWNQATADEGGDPLGTYRLGIYLNPEAMEANMAFYKTFTGR